MVNTANSVDPDETTRSAASHLGLYCLLRPICPNIYGKYGMHCLHDMAPTANGMQYLP